MPRFLRFGVAIIATVAVALTGCGDDSDGPTGPGSVASITVTPATANVAVGATQQMVGTAKDSQGATVTATISWSSSAADRASVSAGGLVTGIAEGTATITASVGSITGTANVTVTPPPVETVEVTPATESMTVSQMLQLTASPKDASGNDVAATVTWSTSDAAIVSVDSNGLATAEAAGRATITATADGKTGTSVLDVVAGAFSPTEDTELSGSPRFADIMIPAGVTVTVTSDLDLSSVGDVMIAGTLTGECVAVAIRGDANLTISGTVSNGCSQGQAFQPDLLIESDGDLTLDGGSIESGGNVTIRNDPTLDDGAFAVGASPSANLMAAGTSDGACRASNFAFVPMPTNAENGTDGQNGTDGEDGHTWRLLCRGDATLAGGVRVFGQDGGAGGTAEHESNTAAMAKGGNGGKGGLIRLLATGTWTFSGSGNEAIGGDGGNGGFAEATGMENFDLEPKAAGAKAESGNGGESGIVEVRSLSSITVNPGALTITVGDGGFASNAVAIGAHGAHADERNNKPAQDGGDAVAVGGLGGPSPDKIFQSTGAITGLSSVVVSGGNGGEGGKAIADGGDGGNGNEDFPDGAFGGDILEGSFAGAEGGRGGNADVKDGAGALIGMGGKGGAITVLGSNGGHGFEGCSVSPVKNGGDGGFGGEIFGVDGLGGMGLGGQAVSLGASVGPVGNGGDGGDGEPTPGTGGAMGTDGIAVTGPPTNTNPSFQRGLDGVDCHSGTYSISIAVTSDPAGHAPFVGMPSSMSIQIRLENLTADGSEIIITGPAPFVAVSGARTAAGLISASGQGTVAGFPNVSILVTGQLTCDGTLTLQYTMGAGGELPQGIPITYTFTGSRVSGVSAISSRGRRLRYGEDTLGALASAPTDGGCG